MSHFTEARQANAVGAAGSCSVDMQRTCVRRRQPTALHAMPSSDAIDAMHTGHNYTTQR